MNECLKWASLADKSAVGETLAAEERLYLRSHVIGCTACATEASVWASLEKVLEEPDRLTSWPSKSDGQASELTFVSPRRWLAMKRRPLLAAIGVVAAAAAAALVGLSAPEPSIGPRPSPLVTRKDPGQASRAGGGARLALAAGDTSVNGQTGVAGQTLAAGAVVSVAAGQACMLVPPGVSVCLDHATDLVIEKLEAGVRRFRLRAGHVVAHLDPQPDGASFGFETPAGAVIAKGTVFSLRTDGSTVTLRVHEGTVLNSQGAETSAYRAPSTALLSHRQPARVSNDELSADAHLIELAKYFGDRSQETLLVTAASGSGVLLDGLSLGMAPVSALIPPGSYRMEVSKPGFVPIVERLTFEPGSRIVREYGATGELSTAIGKQAALSGRGPERPEVVGAGSPSAAMLLEQARALRASGRYREASGVYQRLLRNHAGSSEARVALVSLGELQLSQLGDARAALRSFESYLDVGGPLRQEASYGRVRALRQLGRQSEAQAAIEAFLRTYPNSVQAATLRKEAP